MKRWIAAAVVSLTLVSCAHPPTLPPIVPPSSVSAVLSDIEWSVQAAHDVQWLDDNEYAVAEQILTIANSAVKDSINGSASVVRTVLTAAIDQLPIGSKIVPYIQAALDALKGL